LDRGAHGDDFVWIHSFMRFLAEELAHQLLNLRHPRRSADEYDLVDLLWIEAGIGERLLDRRHGSAQKIVNQLLELRPRQFHLQMFGPGLISRDKRQIDFGFESRRQLDLGLFSSFP
jgi:hypothetical protein